MKNIKVRIVVLTLAAAFMLGDLFVPVSFSQSAAMAVDIPFAFYAAGKLMPAGTYRLEPASAGSWVMEISGDKGNSIFVGTTPVANKRPATGRLVFNRYGSVNFLAELDWAGYDTGHAVIKTSREREFIASKPAAHVVLMAK